MRGRRAEPGGKNKDVGVGPDRSIYGKRTDFNGFAVSGVPPPDPRGYRREFRSLASSW